MIRHYLDDFIIVAPPDSPQCQSSLSILDRECQALGVPHKRDGPTTCLTYLGIEVDTRAGQLRLPSDKFHRVKALLREWGARRTCTHKELESLIGLLNHACKVVRSGHAFLMRMLARPATFRSPSPKLATAYQAEPGFPCRPGLVAALSGVMEWNHFPPPTISSATG